MEYKNKVLKAISEMTESECQSLFDSMPKRFKKTEKQKNCNHSMQYSMVSGGSTCTLCGWQS
jgi:hypothetical protein